MRIREEMVMAGYSKSDKAETHTPIVRVAAKRFRERRLEGIGVADVMKEAGSYGWGLLQTLRIAR
jgi:hypothetical protein